MASVPVVLCRRLRSASDSGRAGRKRDVGKADKDAVDVARADSVKVLFVERSNDPRQASIIAEGIGARLVVVDPLAYDFEQQMTLITNELTRP